MRGQTIGEAEEEVVAAPAQVVASQERQRLGGGRRWRWRGAGGEERGELGGRGRGGAAEEGGGGARDEGRGGGGGGRSVGVHRRRGSRQKGFGRCLPRSILAAIERGDRGEMVREVRRFQIERERERGQRRHVPRDRR